MTENNSVNHAASSEPLLAADAQTKTSPVKGESSAISHSGIHNHLAAFPEPSSTTNAAVKEPNVVSAEEKSRTLQIDQSRKLDKQIPLIMGCSLLAAIIFALVHHFFYWYWDGRAVASDTQQQWIVRGGTAFAFGFKTSLVASSGAAYIQYLWLSLRRRSFKVGEIDSLFDVLFSAIKFANLKLWSGVPLLALLALVTWALPLAAIITPGTLTVSLRLDNTTSNSIVPSLDFTTNVDRFGVLDGGDALDTFGYARDEVVRIALASATSGTIIPMQAPSANATYTIPFYAPGIRCEKANDTAFQYLVKIASNSSQWAYAESASYLAWVPYKQVQQYGSGFGIPSFNNTGFLQAVDTSANTTTGSLISVFTLYAYNETGNFDTNPPKPMYLNCGLRNISYTAHFGFDSGTQSLNITSTTDEGPVNAWASFKNTPEQRRTQSYLSVMFAFNRLISGSINRDSKTGNWLVTSTMIQSTTLSPQLVSATNETLARGLEDLFQNITLSLFSSSNFLADPRKTTQALRASVTNRLSRNIYRYDPLDLYLAYGLALLAGVGCLAVGYLALIHNRVAYTASFTTYLRTTRRRELDGLVVGGEANGSEPAGKRITEARLLYRLTGDESAGFHVVRGNSYGNEDTA